VPNPMLGCNFPQFFTRRTTMEKLTLEKNHATHSHSSAPNRHDYRLDAQTRILEAKIIAL